MISECDKFIRKNCTNEISLIEKKIVEKQKPVILNGYFIATSGRHLRYWIYTKNLCEKIGIPLENFLNKLMIFDSNIDLIAVPWSLHSSTYTPYLVEQMSKMNKKCIVFQVCRKAKENFQDALRDNGISQTYGHNVLILSDLMVTGHLVKRAGEIIRNENNTVKRSIIVIDVIKAKPDELNLPMVKYEFELNPLFKFIENNDHTGWTLENILGKNIHGN